MKKAISREQWRTHILQGHRPYRRDCRACVLDMASGPVHRRREYGGTSAWSMGVDIIQLGTTKDEVTGLDVKYALVGTALVPVFEEFLEQKIGETPKEGESIPEEILEPSWGEGLEDEEFQLSFDSPPERAVVLVEPNPGKREGEEELGSPVKQGEEAEPLLEKQDELEAEIDQCSAPLKLRHVTFAEPLASRSTGDVTHALTVMLVRI